MKARWLVLLAVVLVEIGLVFSWSCGGENQIEGDEAGECNDGADNDQDGLFDCNDDDCDGSPVCGGSDGDADGDGDGDGECQVVSDLIGTWQRQAHNRDFETELYHHESNGSQWREVVRENGDRERDGDSGQWCVRGGEYHIRILEGEFANENYYTYYLEEDLFCPHTYHRQEGEGAQGSWLSAEGDPVFDSNEAIQFGDVWTEAIEIIDTSMTISTNGTEYNDAIPTPFEDTSQRTVRVENNAIYYVTGEGTEYEELWGCFLNGHDAIVRVWTYPSFDSCEEAIDHSCFRRLE